MKYEKAEFVNGETVEIQMGNSKKIVIRETYGLGREMVDLREWVRFTGREDYVPLKRKGFLLSKGIWREKILPVLGRMCDKFK